MNRDFCVYILGNRTNSVLYIGVTSDLLGRIFEHRSGRHSGFTKKYNVNRLLYYESWPGAEEAIRREKQLKAGPRWRKLELIRKENPGFDDLSRGWRI